VNAGEPRSMADHEARARKAVADVLENDNWSGNSDELAVAVLAAARPHLAVAAPPRCPTECDTDCAVPCHEAHQMPWKRDHNPEACVATIVAAAQADERERIAAQVDEYAGNYPEDLFPPTSGSRDAISGTAMRHAYRNAARMIRTEYTATRGRLPYQRGAHSPGGPL